MEKMIFLHIMKCAGTTTRNALKNLYGNKLLYDRYYKRDLYSNKRKNDTRHLVILKDQKYPNNYQNFDCIIGHFKFSKYSHLNWPCVTFLRDPVERIISSYFYLRGNYKRLGYDLNIVEYSKLIANQMTYMVENIDLFEFVGIVEQFDKSFGVMCDIFNMKKPKQIIKKRVSPLKKDKVTKKQRIKIRDNNIKDMRMYEKARREFENIITKS